VAKIVLTNAKVTLNSVDLSDHVETVEINYEAAAEDTTCMGSSGTRTFLGGLKNWTVTLNFRQDFAASSVDVTMFSIVGSVVAISILPVNTTISATNPNYNGNVLVTSYTPIGNTVGEVAAAPVTLQGTDTLSRSTS